MKTRLRSKKGETDEHETSSQMDDSEGVQHDATQVLSIQLPSELDVSELSKLIPETSLTAPTADAVLHLYKLLLSHANELEQVKIEYEEARAENLKKDVELDQAIQDREMLQKETEDTTAEKAREIERLKAERNTLASSKMNLENEKLLLAQAQSSTGSEVEKLKYELSQVESEKRDLLAVVGRLHSDDKQMEEEVQSLRSNLKQVRGEYQELQSQLADLKSSDTHMKFKIQTLEQQLDHAQSSSKSYSEEVATKSEEFSKFRREKHAEIVSLQSSLDSLNTAYSGVQATLQSVQETYGRQNQQLTQATQKVSQLEAQLADQAASFRSESANQERLIELLERRNEQARTRVQEVESEWETMVKTAEERESSLVADLERQKKRGDQLEAVVEELRAEKERAAEGELALLNEETTPGVNRDRGFFTLSPAAGVAARLQKSGKTFTEVYTDYVRIQGELAGSQSEARRLQDLLSQVLADIEERSPVLAQQRQDFERIKAEAEVLTGQLTQTLSERDQYSRRVADLEKQLQSERLMIAELEQSGADLGRQVTNLTRRIAIMENPSLEDIPMLPVAPAEALSADLALSTDQVVLFENLPSLQAQNQKLLRISHSLALAFDRREQELRQGLEREESEAIREANDAIALLEDQIESQSRSHQMRINALAKELEIAKMAAPQQSGALLPPVNGTESQLQTDMQDHFEAYRLELGIDASRLREDLAKSQHELNQKAADLAKANGTIQFLNERQRMMQDEQQLKTREIEALNRRIQDLRDQHTKLELTYSQTADNATHAHSIAERLRTECANLRAEQEIWKSIESRLTSENRVLAKERSQFADLANNIQKMHHDLEMSGQSDRRRMEGQIQSMDLQLQDLRAQVTREREISRNLSLQKDVETRELHLRLDQTTSDLGSAKQSLIKVEADYSHAKARIDELLKEVETAREKLSVYERHPGADVAPLQRHEHELRAEAAQLSADFKQTQQALTAALAHVEQYKSISESNERAFQELTATFDELKKSAQEKLEGKEAEVKSLLQKLNDQQVHTTSLNERIADLDKTLATERLAFKEEQRNLETQIVNLSTSAANSETNSASRDNELRSLEQRAKTSEQKYEDEIKAHAESIKAADLLKQELVQAQAVIRDIQTNADAAEANLATSEASWRNQRAALDKEMADLTKRCQELTGQNERLHAHLESVSAQASRIRQAADAPVDQTDASNGVDDKLSDLRAVVSYLRKEKEIVDLHLEVSRQETARSRNEIEHLSRLLKESRTALSEERERVVQSATSAAEHDELMERINQLNIVRESNATLRAENEGNKRRVSQLQKRVEELSQEVNPLTEKLRVAHAELETRTLQVATLEDDVKRWRERCNELMSKYDRVDPAELQQLKADLEASKTQLKEMEEQKSESEKKLVESSESVEKFRNALQLHKDALAKARTSLQTRQQQFSAEIEAIKTERGALQQTITGLTERVDAASAEVKTLTDQLDRTKQELELERVTSAKHGEAVTLQQELASKITALTQERDALLSRLNLSAQDASEGMSAPSEWIAEKEVLLKEKEASATLISALRTQIEELQRDIAQRSAAQSAEPPVSGAVPEESKKLREQLDEQSKQHAEFVKTLSAQADTLRAELQRTKDASSSLSASHAEEMRALQTRLQAEHSKAIEELRATKVAENKDVDPAALEAIIQSRLADINKDATSQISKLREEIEALRKERDDAKNQGIEQGRKEMGMKLKLKDSQYAKTAKRLQEVEAALANFQPPTPSTASASTVSQGGNSAPVIAAPSAPSAETNTVVSPAAPVAPLATSTPVEGAHGSSTVNTGSPVARRGRGVSLRGAATRGRGGRAAPAGAVAAAGTSILGAAAKRPRESETDTPDDSLVKRLKPANPPITLNRNRPLPPDSSSSTS